MVEFLWRYLQDSAVKKKKKFSKIIGSPPSYACHKGGFVSTVASMGR